MLMFRLFSIREMKEKTDSSLNSYLKRRAKMKAIRYALAVVAIGLFFALPAFAADKSVQNWTGPYVGINGGWGWGETSLKFRVGGSGNDGSNLFSPDSAGGSLHKSIDGGIVGGHAGYNYQTPFNLVLGLEVAVDWSDVSGVRKNAFSPVVPGYTQYDTTVQWFGTATPKIGYAFSNILPYIKGGLAFGGVESRLRTSGSAGRRFIDHNEHIGWTIGAGIEYAWRHFIFGVEYNYIDLGTQHYGGEVTPNTTWPLDYNLRATFSSVVGRVSYKFN
jgi:outer membrane immunogenic protein